MQIFSLVDFLSLNGLPPATGPPLGDPAAAPESFDALLQQLLDAARAVPADQQTIDLSRILAVLTQQATPPDIDPAALLTETGDQSSTSGITPGPSPPAEPGDAAGDSAEAAASHAPGIPAALLAQVQALLPLVHDASTASGNAPTPAPGFPVAGEPGVTGTPSTAQPMLAPVPSLAAGTAAPSPTVAGVPTPAPPALQPAPATAPPTGPVPGPAVVPNQADGGTGLVPTGPAPQSAATAGVAVTSAAHAPPDTTTPVTASVVPQAGAGPPGTGTPVPAGSVGEALAPPPAPVPTAAAAPTPGPASVGPSAAASTPTTTAAPIPGPVASASSAPTPLGAQVAAQSAVQAPVLRQPRSVVVQPGSSATVPASGQTAASAPTNPLPTLGGTSAFAAPSAPAEGAATNTLDVVSVPLADTPAPRGAIVSSASAEGAPADTLEALRTQLTELRDARTALATAKPAVGTGPLASPDAAGLMPADTGTPVPLGSEPVFAGPTFVSLTDADGQPIPVPTTLRDLPEQMVQTARFLAREHGGVVQLQLKPASLGQITVQVIQEHELIRIELTAQSHQVREMLQGQLPHLKQQLTDQGLTLGSLTVSVETGGHQAPANSDGSAPASPMSAESGEGGTDATAADAAAPTPALAVSGRLDLIA